MPHYEFEKKNEDERSDAKLEKSIEVLSEVIQPSDAKLDIELLTKDYNNFMDESKTISDEIGDVIDIKEMQDISDLIKKFNDRLEGVVSIQTQTDVEKTTNKVVQTLSMIPFIGKLLENEAADGKEKAEHSKTSREILQEMFDVFNEKSVMLEGSFERSFKLKEILLVKEIKLDIFSSRIKHLVLNTQNPLDKIKGIKLGGLIESNKLKNKEKIYNKLDFILQFIEEQLTTISLMMPGIESGLVEDNEISSFLTSISDMNKIFKSLTTLSNSIGRSSSEKVMKLITEVNESMSDTVDVDHMENLALNNKKFMQQMISGTEAKLRRDAVNYGKLVDIGTRLDKNVLEYNISNQRVLLETSKYLKTDSLKEHKSDLKQTTAHIIADNI